MRDLSQTVSVQVILDLGRNVLVVICAKSSKSFNKKLRVISVVIDGVYV